MSKTTARAISTAVLGGVMVVLFSTHGLQFWAGLVAWAGFLAAGGDATALKRTIIGSTLGAALACASLMTIPLIVVAPDSWLWIPRIGAAVAVTLLVLVLASRVDALSQLPASLLGFAAVYGVCAIPDVQHNLWERLTGLHLYNPFIQVVLSMVGGTVFGLISTRIEMSLSRADGRAVTPL